MTDPLPLVSVVIPSYNRAGVVRETVDSVLAQTYGNIEVIVIDDGSSDNTAEVLAPYADRIVYVRNRNSGLAATRNAGMRLASGEFIAWVDSDDLWTPQKLEVQAGYMLRHPDVVMSATDFSSFNHGGILERSHIRSYYSIIDNTPGGLSELYASRELWTVPVACQDDTGLPGKIDVYSGDMYRSLVLGNCLHPPTVLIRRSAVLAAGDLDISFANMADYDYFIRLGRLGRIAYIDHPFTLYRYSDDLEAEQMSSDARLGEIKSDVLRIIRKVADEDAGFARDNRRLYLRRLSRCHLDMADVHSESRGLFSLRHMASSMFINGPDRRMIRILMKILLPSALLALYRGYKRKMKHVGDPA